MLGFEGKLSLWSNHQRLFSFFFLQNSTEDAKMIGLRILNIEPIRKLYGSFNGRSVVGIF
jgi:hypothetical protein